MGTKRSIFDAGGQRPTLKAIRKVVGERLGEVGAEIWTLALQVVNERLAGEREALDAARLQTEQERMRRSS